MFADRLKFHGGPFWLLAALTVCIMEIYAATARRSAEPVEHLAGVSAGNLEVPGQTLMIGRINSADGPVILVLGNPGTVGDQDIDVVLKATLTDESAVTTAHWEPSGRLSPSRQPPIRPQANHGPSDKHPETNRLYFLQTSFSNPEDSTGHTAIFCLVMGENKRIRVYVDQRLPRSESLAELVDAVLEASASRLGDAIEELVGPVCDVDQDGRLAVVLTPEVARLGSGRTPVDGLTRPTDFVPGLDRPRGNSSDVIFLNSGLRPGQHLKAVLAHEWCHAAIFGRGQGPAEDWLNEGLAHLVEFQASGSTSNLSHRIERFLSCPGDSPLAIQDYAQPKYWRHDGCRGAAYLFLLWCAKQSDAQFLDRLISSRLNRGGLETAMGQSFDDLFRGWTTSLGQRLADQLQSGQPGTGLKCQTWAPRRSPERTLRVQGSCAEFIRIDCGGLQGTWQFTATTEAGDYLQATLVTQGSEKTPTPR